MRITWQFHASYNEEQVKEEYLKNIWTNKISKAMKKHQTKLEQAVHLYNPNPGIQQHNEWRFAVQDAIKNGETKSTIARAIRKVKGSPNWDGTAYGMVTGNSRIFKTRLLML